MRNTTAKKVLSLFLGVIMILSCMSASFGFMASALEWQYIEGVSYNPVTLYVQRDTMEFGKTYMIAVDDETKVINGANATITRTDVSANVANTTSYVTSDTGSDKPYVATGDYIVDESNVYYTNNEFQWQKETADSGYLYSAGTGLYLINASSSVVRMASKSGKSPWTYDSAGSKLYIPIDERPAYLRVSDSGTVTLKQTDSNNVCYFYEKVTAYKIVEGNGSLFKYVGQTDFAVDINTELNEQAILDTIAILHKEQGEEIPDEECAKLKITDESVDFFWDEDVNMNKLGDYTGTVYVYGEPIQTLTVHVQDHSAVFNGIADPSTSRIESRFSLTKADDGKLASDKTVQYGSDEFGTFGSYAGDEFSVALSALGQGYEMVETEETILTEKVHPDVVFIIDASGSMRVYNVAGEEICRGEATAFALNNAIKDLYEEDPDTRIGIVTYNNDVLEGVFLPLDKYTLPEGQTDYITWDGRNVATVKPATTPDISGVVNYLNPVVSVGTIPAGTTYYFYPEDGTLTRSDDDYQVMRYSVTSTGKIDQYNKGSVSPNSISSSLADGKYIVDNVNGYAFYRRGNAVYMYNADEFNAYLDSINAENYNTYTVKTVSESQTVTGFPKSSRQPGSYSSGGKSYYNNPSDKKTIATVNGVTYSGVYYGSQIYIYKTGHDLPVARMMSTPTDNYYTKVFTDANITITCNHSSSSDAAEVTYTTNTYSQKTGTPTFTFEENEYMMATNYLINSKGESVAPSCYTFIGNLGTYTQGGLQAAENMFADADNKANRVPAIVLLSDGVPTIGNSNTQNPGLTFKEGVTDGYGLSTSPQTSNGLSNYGLWMIETAMKVKDNVNEMYSDSGNREGLFYSIGPGVDYIFGQTILDPSNENIEKALAKTTNVGEDTESGVGVPSDLARKIMAKYTDLDYVNYADWSYTGDVTSEELDRAFRKIVTSIVDIQRPVVEITTTEYGEDDITGAMNFTDNIGKGMEVSSDLVVRYGNNNYEPTNKTETTLEDGTKVTRFYYDYRVVEQSTRKAYNLKGLTVLLLTNPDGTQTVKWYIPGDLIPVIMYDGFDEKYVPVSPIRLVYKVAIEDDGLKGTFYTNSTDPDEIANAEFVPAIGNPYYYDNVIGDDNKVHSVVKDYDEEIVNKTRNSTDTASYSSDTYMASSDGTNCTIDTKLGNNGLIQVDLTNIYFTKMWDDGNDVSKQRPDDIQIQLYRNGYLYGEPMTISEEDCTTVTDEDGNDGWYCIIKGLPFSPDFVYTVEEYEVLDYESVLEKVGDEVTVTNVLDRSQLSYELYLVDKDGNPVDEFGNIVDFEDRVFMSDTVGIDTYIHTTESIDLDELEELLPPGYYIYNPDTSFTETYEGRNNTGNKATVVDDSTGTTVVSYPDSASIDRNGNVTGLGDFSKIIVDFAIAKIDIVPDVIVVDYGKTILCSPLDNDSGNSVQLLGIGDINGTTYSKQYTTEDGVFRVEGNNVTFSPFSYMNTINRVKYYVSTVSDDPAFQELNSTIAVIPATTMYYEDDFGGSKANGGLYINYTGEWYNVDSEGNTTLGLDANTDIYDRQDRGEVGQEHTPYGYDSSYDGCTEFSNGTAAMVEGTISLNPITHRPQFDATAEFEFIGTGFDIISRTDLDCGMITVYVTNSQGKSVNVPVINKGVDNLYQIPVISFDCADYFDYAYDSYTVKINVNAPSEALKIDGAVFYLDAIRIYNPMGQKSSDNPEFDEANAAYNADHEANEYYALIRDCILDVGMLDETEQYGAVYVDTINNDYEGGGLIYEEDYDEESGDEEEERTSGADTLAYRKLNQSMIKDFELIGPNQEVYLSPGYGVGFIVETTKKPASVQLEMKIPSPIKRGASLSVYTYGQTAYGRIAVDTATEMFYDITSNVRFKKQNGVYRAIVILENGLPSVDVSEIVSITNIKLTYDNDVIALDAADESIFSLDSVDDNVAVTSLKANWELYQEVFDSVYTHRMASTPNYEIAEVESVEETASGKTVTATVKTSRYVDDLIIRDPYGNVVKPVSISSELDESKILTGEYKEAKTWTVSFKVYGVNGSAADYTVESANGEGEVSKVSFEIVNPKVTGISVYSAPDKTTYNVGETFDSEGLALKVTYSDGSTKVVNSGFSTEDVKFTKTGSKNVKVSYGGEETTVKVKAKRSLLQILLTFLGLGWLFG